LRSTTDISSASDGPAADPAAVLAPLAPGGPPPPARGGAGLPRRWTLHGLNNGAIFTATHIGVSRLPRRLSYAIGYAGTYIAWRTMRVTRRAVASNLAAVFPDESAADLERRALSTLRSYAKDVIDFLRVLARPPEQTIDSFQVDPAYRQTFERLHALGRGMILVSGHYGNWEIGALLITRVLRMPMAVVAMAEADPEVNELRRRLRDRVGADTVEVRQSLDTALQLRRRLADNQIIAMLVDRHYGRDRVSVTMFGRQAWFLRTPLLMAHATGAPLVPCYIERDRPGRFIASPSPEIYVRRDVPREDAIAEAAQRLADDLAARVRRRPDLWYHFYRYWDAQRDAYDGLA
jgi:KDO2-lipid IV(A) lauroyltransferase